MLRYIHTQITTHRYRTSKQKCLQVSGLSLIHTSLGLGDRPPLSQARVMWIWNRYKKGQNTGAARGVFISSHLQKLFIVRMTCKWIIPDSKDGCYAFLSSLTFKIAPLGNMFSACFKQATASAAFYFCGFSCCWDLVQEASSPFSSTASPALKSQSCCLPGVPSGEVWTGLTKLSGMSELHLLSWTEPC